MLKQLVGISVLSLAALGSTGAFAHSGKYLADGFGNKVVDGSNNCVLASNGTDACAEPAPAPAPAPATAPAAAPAPAPEPAPVVVQKAVTLAGDTTFATNSDQLSAEGRASIDSFVAELNSTPNLQVSKINVVGHADSRGNDDYNQGLSERRAATVGSYLVSKGVSPSLITTSGRGESDPVASNSTAQGRAANRRVEIGLSGVQQFSQ
jgi:OOP family OmpA-OmpF porin